MFANINNYIKTTLAPRIKALLKIIQYNIYLYGTIVYLFIICVVVMFFYLKSYKGIVKNYCGTDEVCYDGLAFYEQIGLYCITATIVYLIYVGTKNSTILATVFIGAVLGMNYMVDAWKIKIDGAVFDDEQYWTVCRLIRKYAPYNPTIPERLRIIMPIMTIVMFLSFMYLLSIIGFTSREMPYFIASTIVLFGLIGWKTYTFMKY